MDTIKEQKSQPPLQMLDHAAQARLRSIEHLGRGTHGVRQHDRPEDFDLPEIEHGYL
jgi:hypothetical protein